jgi:hypothetical protein
MIIEIRNFIQEHTAKSSSKTLGIRQVNRWRSDYGILAIVEELFHEQSRDFLKLPDSKRLAEWKKEEICKFSNVGLPTSFPDITLIRSVCVLFEISSSTGSIVVIIDYGTGYFNSYITNFNLN